MGKRVAFIGHSMVFSDEVLSRLVVAIEKAIACDCSIFTTFTQGEFNRSALRACKQLKETYPDITIEEIAAKSDEKAPGKWQIKKLVNDCDLLICYVDKRSHKNASKFALHYAHKTGVKVLNLYKDEDWTVPNHLQ